MSSTVSRRRISNLGVGQFRMFSPRLPTPSRLQIPSKARGAYKEPFIDVTPPTRSAQLTTPRTAVTSPTEPVTAFYQLRVMLNSRFELYDNRVSARIIDSLAAIAKQNPGNGPTVSITIKSENRSGTSFQGQVSAKGAVQLMAALGFKEGGTLIGDATSVFLVNTPEGWVPLRSGNRLEFFASG